MPELRLHNTLTRSKEVFRPIDATNVRMYVCGPTVYDYAHIGNARPAIVFDVLFRLLRHRYGEAHVTYVRNITDVDDKINARAARDFPGLPLNEAIRKVTETTAAQYQKDVTRLGCLEPTVQPRATDFVLPRADGKADMASLIQSLIDRGHAYEAAGEILFDVRSMPDYGSLSRRPLDEQIAGARVAVEAHKRNPADFVLWKRSSADEPGWDASFRVAGRDLPIRGRPGWHIECSAMAAAYLGEVFDIHGGGLDLIFPHHENEIAQSRCAHGSKVMANTWLHNGFLQVEGRKMSKSEGNFVTIDELLSTEKFGGRRWPGEVLRLAMLMTHYRDPIDFSVRRLEEALDEYRWYQRILRLGYLPEDGKVIPAVADAITDDLNTPKALSALHHSSSDLADVAKTLDFLGVYGEKEFNPVRAARKEKRRDVSRALEEAHVKLMLTELDVSEEGIKTSMNQRLELIQAKNWLEADRIRDELLARGIQLKDGKDPQTGERITTWELKR